jgi:hypothetical protein
MAEAVETPWLWGNLGIGHTLLKDGRKWEVVAAAAPAQYEYGYSNWLKVRAPNGEEHPIPPRRVKMACTVLLDPEADPIPPASHVHGSAEAALLVEQLGAQEIATQDAATGEVWCPWTVSGVVDELHLRVAHGMDTTGLESIDARVNAHGKAHDGHYPLLGKGGFAHRHVPEDISIT